MTDAPATVFAKDQLRSFVERVERLTSDKDEIASDIRDVYAEAKGQGFDVAALRAIIRLRKIDTDKRREAEAILDTYMLALGMLADTPLGRAAVERVRHEPPLLKKLVAADNAKRSKPPDPPRAKTLVNPNDLPDEKTIKDIADRAEKRSRDTEGSGGSVPPATSNTPQSTPAPAAASASTSPPDDLDIPLFLRRKPEVPGHQAQGP
jgi:uncharacterized protein (UPF0335 family)